MARHLKVVAREQCIGCFSCMFACSRTWHGAMTTLKSAIRVKAYTGTEATFSIRACRACPDPDCVAACPTGALAQKKSGALHLAREKCNRCGACVEACLFGALAWDEGDKMPLPCSHCGVCVRYCPNQVLAMVEREESHVDARSRG